jgi:cytochrome c biogenesis protein CcdA
MGHALPAVLLIAVADSVNPATIAPALYFAAGKTAVRSLLGFIAGVFVVYLVGGLVLMLGPGQALLALIPRPGVEERHLLELALGVGLLVLAGALWVGRRRLAHHVSSYQDRLDRSAFLVGVGIVTIEFPTAFPYFAAIAVIVDSAKNVSIQISLLMVFDVVFVAPLLAILAVRSLARDRGRGWLERLRAGIEERLAVLLPGFVLVAAVALVLLGAVGVTRD